MSSLRTVSNSEKDVDDGLDVQKVFAGQDGLFCILLFALVVQLSISTGSYSGYNKPPMYGDFEAQRHWMEITVNLPPDQWYVNGTNNDLNYWGLDYPPLTAYHSYFLGKISQRINSSWVALHESRGVEYAAHKFFMRLSVLATMWMLYIPAFLFFIFYISKCEVKNYFTAISILYPGLIAMDNGHFQYNHVALGFFLIAFVLFISDRLVFGSIFFVLAVHFKQMELYHALPVAVYLFFTCIPVFHDINNLSKSMHRIMKLALVVFVSTASLWLPLRGTPGFPFTILGRIFPFYRGIFEDKVANLWCAVNVAVKLKQVFSMNQLIRMSALCVLVSHVPSLAVLAWRPTAENFKKALFLSSLSFFLFSFQVHEKSILFVAIPALLLWPEYRIPVSWFLVIANSSLYPLCIQDGNELHLALFAFYYAIVVPVFSSLDRWKRAVVHLSCIASLVLCLTSLFVSPPQRFPHIFPLLTAIYSFVHFLSFFLFFNFVMLRECSIKPKSKKS